MLKYFGLDNEWHTLDLMAVKGIYSKGRDRMSIRMKDGSWIVAQVIENR